MPTGTLLSFSQFAILDVVLVIPATSRCWGSVKTGPIEEMLSLGDLDKPLSSLYGALLCTHLPRMGKLWDYLRGDIPSLNREDWEASLEQGPKLVISSRDKLIQVKFLH